MSKASRALRNMIGCVVIAILIMPLAGCSEGEGFKILEKQAEQFSIEKETKSLTFHSGDEILETLANHFSAAQEQPTGNPLSAEEADKVKDDSDDKSDSPSQGDATEPSDDSDTHGISEDEIERPDSISTREDVKSAFHYMMDQTETSDSFALEGNHAPDSEEMNRIYLELESEDAYDSISIKSYSWGCTTDGTFVLSIEYHLPVEEVKKIKKETRDLVQEAMGELPEHKDDQYSTIVAINDYLCDVVSYAEDEPYEAVTHTAYGAFKNGVAVCDGYSRAAKLLLDENDIECYMITGDTAGGGHAWNLVKVDGEWYHMDTTWNDESGRYDQSGRESFLLVTDEYMKNSRIWPEGIWPESAEEAYYK